MSLQTKRTFQPPMNLVKWAIEQIETSRQYTLELLKNVSQDDWFRSVTATIHPAWNLGHGVTHIGWQVGHLAVAQYKIALLRVRGETSEDHALIPPHFVALFDRGTIPADDPQRYPAVAEITNVLNRVHEQTLAELRDLSERELLQPAANPHPRAKTILDCYRWCSQHEMLHAGQIGLIKRLLGYRPA